MLPSAAVRWVGVLTAALWLAGCEPVALAQAAVSITLTLAVSREQAASLSASLTPSQAKLRPGEATTLQLEVRNNSQTPRALTLEPQVDPADGVTVTLPTEIVARQGVTRVAVRVVALPNVIPGRYDIEIRIRSPDG